MSDEFRPLTADDMDQLLDVRSVSYGPIVDRDRAAAALTWRLPHSLGVFRGGRLRSVSFMYPFEAYLGGGRVTLGALSGVATGPEARRGGLVAQSLRRWYADLHERGIAWSAEHPFEPTFYGKLGYQTVHNGHTLEMTPAELRASTRARLEEPRGAEPVGMEAVPELHRIYTAYARRFSFTLARDDGVRDHWANTFKRATEDVTYFCYLMEDAYAVFTTENGTDDSHKTTLWVRDMAYSTPAGRERLYGFLAAFEGQVTAVRLHVPPGDTVALDRAAYWTDKAPEMQVRIVDVASALSNLAWPGNAALNLRVADADCPWNDGVFVLDLGPQGGTVERDDTAQAEAALDVRALAALVTGATTAETLLADGRAEGPAEKLRPIGAALASHPVFKPHNDHF